MSAAKDILDSFGVPHDVQVLSAHRTPEAMMQWGKSARDNGFSVIIAGAGGAAHLPGMLASVTSLPVIGVPVSLSPLDGLDSLLSIAQMPSGIPVATVAIGNAANAALLAIRMLAIADAKLSAQLDEYADTLAESVSEKNTALKDSLS
jgi:5-(carboxyamino)imidazole ribonucleotide mutase